MGRTHLRRDLFYTFDIETTTLVTGVDEEGKPIRNAIIWSGQFYDGTNYEQTRSLSDTIKRLQIIADENKDNPYKVAIFVHNLSYEFQFIKDFFNFTNILATSNRQIIAAETDQLVFRCSYRLSNMSLAKFLKNENVPEEYQKTNMDYLVDRFPWTPLTDEEKTYCANDVIGLHLAIQNRLKGCHNQDINNLPLTSTGYVRKDCRKAVNAKKRNRYRFWKEKLDKETFLMCHAAFRGGNTHANRLYANKVMKHVGQKDERSAYPCALMEKYPTAFFDMKPFKQKEFDFYLSRSDNWAMLIEVCWKNIRLKEPNKTPVPYISTSKCNFLRFSGENHALEVDNGRVMSACFLQTIITEVDYEIIRKQYIWDDEKISRVKVSKKRYIPKELREQILKYYYNKTTLKQDENDPNFDPDKFYMYNQNKSLLNGIYGMHVSNPCKSDYTFNEITHEVIETRRDEQELLDEYYKSFSNFLSYQVGVWCTAYARRMLQEGIDLLYNEETGRSDLIYCDTDSIKYLNPELHEKDIYVLNKKREQFAEEQGAFVDFKGKRYHLGIFTDEGVVEKFKTFGAKKYLYGDDNHFKITISGVPKKSGAECIKEAIKRGRMKSPFDLKKGFVFHGVKMTSCYMDHNKIYDYEIEPGKIVHYASNVAMYPNSYTLGLTYEYELLLNEFNEVMNDE